MYDGVYVVMNTVQDYNNSPTCLIMWCDGGGGVGVRKHKYEIIYMYIYVVMVCRAVSI